jgi:hypothetical protein
MTSSDAASGGPRRAYNLRDDWRAYAVSEFICKRGFGLFTRPICATSNTSHRTGSDLDMATRVFLWPHTGQRVQGWFAEDGSEDAGGETYEGVSCLACNQFHMVNRRTGKVLGADEE